MRFSVIDYSVFNVCAFKTFINNFSTLKNRKFLGDYGTKKKNMILLSSV